MPWRLMDLRGQRVFARANESGELIDEGGRVEIRYKQGLSKSYRAARSNLAPLGSGQTELFPDGHCVSENAIPSAKDDGPAAKARKGKAPKRGPKAPESAKNPPEKPEGDEILVYADGACSGNPGPAGLGVVMLWDDHCKELSEYLGAGTNNIAELTAILRACEGTPDRSRPIHIYTDSNYSIGVLTKGWKAKANQELILLAKKVMLTVHDVKLFYVRGHRGIPLNERADALAREAVAARETRGWNVFA
jgi:ribonuclease HI